MSKSFVLELTKKNLLFLAFRDQTSRDKACGFRDGGVYSAPRTITLVTKTGRVTTAHVAYLWILTPVSRYYFVAFEKKMNRAFVNERPSTF